jgi:pilus assembly protein TadC
MVVKAHPATPRTPWTTARHDLARQRDHWFGHRDADRLADLLPLLALGLPYLLLLPKQRDIELLEALDRWVRSLAATLATGKSITDAIRISRRTAPPMLADEINLLVTRLNNRWETRDALMRFADAIDSPDADGVVAALILASSRGANGASITLQVLADSIQAQLKGRRAIEVERSKPYVVVRQVTVISMSTLVLVFVLSPDFFAPYRTPLGQALLAALLIIYVASLILMRRKAHQPDRPRILVGDHR